MAINIPTIMAGESSTPGFPQARRRFTQQQKWSSHVRGCRRSSLHCYSYTTKWDWNEFIGYHSWIPGNKMLGKSFNIRESLHSGIISKPECRRGRSLQQNPNWKYNNKKVQPRAHMSRSISSCIQQQLSEPYSRRCC